jgi:hypothetical protein
MRPLFYYNVFAIALSAIAKEEEAASITNAAAAAIASSAFLSPQRRTYDR